MFLRRACGTALLCRAHAKPAAARRFPRWASTGALSGIRVLDLSRVLAGPWATQLLADFGAEVIKVEKPGSGDDTRAWGPPFVQGESAYFMCANRGKKSITVDIAHPKGQDLIRKLAKISDVFIENFKVDNLKKYGLDYDSLKELNPKLVYCSITGFGQTGPRREEPGYDFIVQGMAGLMSITGEKAGMPMKVGVAVVDVFTGLYAANAIQAALLNRAHSGQGQYIDMALFDSAIAILANQGLNYLTSSKAPGRLGNQHPNIVPYSTFACSDGHIIVAVGNDTQYFKLCKAMGRDDLVADPRFATNKSRVAHRDVLYAELNKTFLTRTKSEWLDIINEIKVSTAPINTIDEVFADPQAVAREMRVEMEHHDLPEPQKVSLIGNPIKFSGTPVRYELAPPVLGFHTSQVLKSLLGMSQTEIADLKSQGVL